MTQSCLLPPSWSTCASRLWAPSPLSLYWLILPCLLSHQPQLTWCSWGDEPGGRDGHYRMLQTVRTRCPWTAWSLAWPRKWLLLFFLAVYGCPPRVPLHNFRIWPPFWGGGCDVATGKSGELEGGGEIREYICTYGYMFSLFSHCLLEIYSTKSAVSCQLFYSTAPIKFLFFKYFFHLCVQFMFSSPSLL